MRKLKGYATPDHHMARYFKGHVPFEVSQLFRRFKAAVGTYVGIPEWVVTGSEDFEIEYVGQIPQAGFYLVADKDSTNTTQRFGFTASQQPYGLNNTGQIFGTGHSADSFSFHHVKVRRLNQVLSVFVHGVSVGSIDSSTAIKINCLFRAFAGATSVPFLDGYPLLLKLSNLSNPHKSRCYKRFCEPSDIVPNELDEPGQEMWIGMPIQGYINSGSSQENLAYDGNNTLTTDWIPVVGNETYVIERKGSRSRWQWKDTEGNISYGGDHIPPLLKAPETATHIRCYYALNNDESAFSIRPANGTGALLNAADGSVVRFTKHQQAWLGPDIKHVSAGSTWSPNADGSYTHTGSNWGSWLYLGGEAGDNYEVDVTAVNPSATGLSNGLSTYLTAGRQKLDLPPGSAAPRIGSNSGTTVTIHSVKQKIPLAAGAPQ